MGDVKRQRSSRRQINGMVGGARMGINAVLMIIDRMSEDGSSIDATALRLAILDGEIEESVRRDGERILCCGSAEVENG